jgi:hypothetical protein
LLPESTSASSLSSWFRLKFSHHFSHEEKRLRVTLGRAKGIRMLRRGASVKSTLQIAASVLMGTLLLSAGDKPSDCDPASNVHASNICKLTLGMTPVQALDAMNRPPDVGQEQNGDIVSGWKLAGGHLLMVRFRKKRYVSALSLDFHPLLRSSDLGLPTAYEDQYASGGVQGTNLAGRGYPTNSGSQLKDNPKLRVSYHRDETQNSERVIWSREEDSAAGYKLEVGFLSASRLRAGERVYQNDVASKYVTVRKSDLDKFDRAMERQINSATP